jgi:hypothetical protein
MVFLRLLLFLFIFLLMGILSVWFGTTVFKPLKATDYDQDPNGGWLKKSLY